MNKTHCNIFCKIYNIFKVCGINGLLYKKDNQDISKQLQLMNGLICHRGPDDDGTYVTARAGMGMRRLSIIDLSTGNQPMKNEAGDVTIIFNGEIYNYQVLKLELENEGVVFNTQSDTEVILRLYEKYGEGLLSRLNGMFAFSIHDVKNKLIFIARDRFGEKPLYYYHSDEKVAWASELKSIVSLFPELKQISAEALVLFFSLTYIPAPYSIYQNIYKLEPGHYLKFDTTTLQQELHEYWDINTEKNTGAGITYDSAKKEVRNLLFESVEQRMIADVPLGVFLSGGVDSAIIASVMAKISNQKVQTFTVGYENKRYDESARAKQIATHIGADHHEYVLDYKDIFNKVDEVILNYDEPYADSSCLPTYFISSKTVQHVKVALTGDGGDEVFGGYDKYMLQHYRDIYRKYVPGFIKPLFANKRFIDTVLGRSDSKSIFSKVRKVADIINEELIPGHLNIIALGFRQAELEQLFTNGAKDYKSLLAPHLAKLDRGTDALKQLRYIDKQISLEGDMLVKVDRASMLSSLECRSPFLDHRLMEYTYQLPDSYLINKGSKKRILKDTFEDMVPPGYFEAPKSGFEVPVGEWFKGPLKQDLLDTLSETALKTVGLFNVDYISRLIDEHISDKANHAHQLWTLYCFQKWFKNNIYA
jgi:asparagine synthase (glutamine-hydrolysing)